MSENNQIILYYVLSLKRNSCPITIIKWTTFIVMTVELINHFYTCEEADFRYELLTLSLSLR